MAYLEFIHNLVETMDKYFENVCELDIMFNLEKIIHFDDISHMLGEMKAQQKTISFTNGCFDILHKGHLTCLNKAKSRADILWVGLNSDSSVKRLKGESRPVNNEEARAFLLANLICVDFITIFSQDTPVELIKLSLIHI